MAKTVQTVTTDVFTVPEIAALLGETRETVRAVFRDRVGQVSEVKGKRYFYRIPQSEVERLIRDKSEGVISLLGLFVLASAAHNVNAITDEKYQEIRDKTVCAFREAMQYPASRQFLYALMEVENLDKTVMRLYYDAIRLEQQ